MTLAAQHCRDGAPALDDAAIASLLADVPAWRVADGALRRSYRFPNCRPASTSSTPSRTWSNRKTITPY